MKSLAVSNRHLRTSAARKDGVERNVRSSSAVEGVSAKVFREAASGRIGAAPKAGTNARVSHARAEKP